LPVENEVFFCVTSQLELPSLGGALPSGSSLADSNAAAPMLRCCECTRKAVLCSLHGVPCLFVLLCLFDLQLLFLSCFGISAESYETVKQHTCIHSDKNLAIFCMPPIEFPVALKGCKSFRACFRHLGASMEQKFFKSSIAFFFNMKCNHLYNFRYFL